MRTALALVLAAVASTAAWAQPGDAQPHERPRRGGGPPELRADPATDKALLALKAAISADDSQWKQIEARFVTLRTAQFAAIRAVHEELTGDHQDDGPPPREEMEKLLGEKFPPLNDAFIKDARAMLHDEQIAKFDEWAKNADLSPPKPGPGGPGGRRGNTPTAPLPPNAVTIEVKDGVRTITSNGVPDHDHGQFPGRGNPNTIAAQSYTFRVPVAPKMNDKPQPQRGVLSGVALNGVVFDPGTAEFWKDDPSTGWRLEAIAPEGVHHRDLGIDSSHAHVQPNGAYHYHGIPLGLIEEICTQRGLKRGEAMIQIGWAADGFPIYDSFGHTDAKDAKSPLKQLRSSYQLKKEDRPGGEQGPGGKPDGNYTRDYEFVAGSGDLDECNGRFGATPEFPDGTYYYVTTTEFPSIHRMLRATPDKSFRKMDGPPQNGGETGQNHDESHPR